MPARSKLMIRFLLFLIKLETQRRTRSFITFIKEIWILYQIFVVQHFYTDISPRHKLTLDHVTESWRPPCPWPLTARWRRSPAPASRPPRRRTWRAWPSGRGLARCTWRDKVRLRLKFVSLERLLLIMLSEHKSCHHEWNLYFENCLLLVSVPCTIQVDWVNSKRPNSRFDLW